MSPKWYDYAEKSTAPDEHIKRNYSGKLDGEWGYIMISDKKLFFVTEEGFFRKKYSIPFNLPYEEVEDIKAVDEFELQISEKNGKTHKFVSDDLVRASRIYEAIQEEMHGRSELVMH